MKNFYSMNSWNRLRHTYVLSLLVLATTFVYLYKDNLQILLLSFINISWHLLVNLSENRLCVYSDVAMNILRWFPFLHSFYTSFQNSPYGHGTDGFLTSFLCFRISHRNFLCYFRRDFYFSISKTPTMKPEKMLKISYQKRSYFFRFLNILSFIRTSLCTRHIKQAQLKQPSRNLRVIKILES